MPGGEGPPGRRKESRRVASGRLSIDRWPMVLDRPPGPLRVIAGRATVAAAPAIVVLVVTGAAWLVHHQPVVAVAIIVFAVAVVVEAVVDSASGTRFASLDVSLRAPLIPFTRLWAVVRWILGWRRGRRIGTGPSVAEAEQWYRRAASHGNVDSMRNLGLLLVERGEVAEAEQWYRRAADLGDAHAMDNLGLLFVKRGAVAEAEHWWRRAANQGEAAAMYNLGVLLEERGDEASVAEAAHWLDQAKRAGVEGPQ
jgi:Tetratricopeptide repeat/Sel1 repeat